MTPFCNHNWSLYESIPHEIRCTKCGKQSIKNDKEAKADYKLKETKVTEAIWDAANSAWDGIGTTSEELNKTIENINKEYGKTLK